MRTRKWSALLAAVIAMTGLSNITLAADYTTGLTGAYGDDNELVKVDGSSVIQSGNSTIYDFGGRDQSFSVTNADAVSFSESEKSFIVNNIGANESKGTITLRSQNTDPNGVGNSGLNIGSCNATINSNLVIETSAAYMTDGIQVGGNGTLTINGSVKMRKDDADSPWGVVTKNVHGNLWSRGLCDQRCLGVYWRQMAAGGTLRQ